MGTSIRLLRGNREFHQAQALLDAQVPQFTGVRIPHGGVDQEYGSEHVVLGAYFDRRLIGVLHASVPYEDMSQARRQGVPEAEYRLSFVFLVHRVAVIPAARRLGIGRDLCDAARGIANDNDLALIAASIPHGPEVMSFFESCGYQISEWGQPLVLSGSGGLEWHLSGEAQAEHWAVCSLLPRSSTTRSE